MTKRTWHKGPPPHVGWWNACIERDLNAWRWWNGKYWSVQLHPNDTQAEVGVWGGEKTEYRINDIEWTNYYPANARVPRIDPSKGEVK